MATILIIDDDKGVQYLFRTAFEKDGYQTLTSSSLQQGIAYAQEEAIDVVLLNVDLPDGAEGSGLEHIADFKANAGNPDIILIAEDGATNGAELAVRHGAWDYLSRKSSLSDVHLIVNRVLQHREKQAVQEAEPAVAERTVAPAAPVRSLIGESWAFRNAVDTARKYANTDEAVLLTGEAGTGKDAFARFLHDNSARRDRPFVVMDCARLPGKMAQTVLFGSDDLTGLIAEAEGGTLFLDEISALPLDIQGLLCHVLEERSFCPVGTATEQQCDIRVISATDRDLSSMVEGRTFRSDFLSQIQTCALPLPPLRSREQDVCLLAAHFAELYTYVRGEEPKPFSSRFSEALKRYYWPGNVRELQQVIEHALSMSRQDEALLPHHLPVDIRVYFAEQDALQQTSGTRAQSDAELLSIDWDQAPTLAEYRDRAVAVLEKRYLKELLEQDAASQKARIQTAGLSRSRFYALLQKYSLNR